MKLNKGEAIVRANAKSVVLLTVCASVLACAAGLGCLQGCSPQEAASQGAAPKAEAANGSITLTEWTTETDCSTCHADEASSRQDAACTASKHTSLQCADCHTDTATLAKQHEGASSDDRMPLRLKQTTVEASVCLSCHDQDEIAAESSSCTALSDAQGTTVNPHELPETDTHGQIACTDCHSMHEEQTDLQGDAKAYCMSCHHADVFECYTCHEHS